MADSVNAPFFLEPGEVNHGTQKVSYFASLNSGGFTGVVKALSELLRFGLIFPPQHRQQMEHAGDGGQSDGNAHGHIPGGLTVFRGRFGVAGDGIIEGVIQGAARNHGDDGRGSEHCGRSPQQPGHDFREKTAKQGREQIGYQQGFHVGVHQQVEPPGGHTAETSHEQFQPPHMKEDGEAKGAEKGGGQLPEQFRTRHP